MSGSDSGQCALKVFLFSSKHMPDVSKTPLFKHTRLIQSEVKKQLVWCLCTLIGNCTIRCIEYEKYCNRLSLQYYLAISQSNRRLHRYRFLQIKTTTAKWFSMLVDHLSGKWAFHIMWIIILSKLHTIYPSVKDSGRCNICSDQHSWWKRNPCQTLKHRIHCDAVFLVSMELSRCHNIMPFHDLPSGMPACCYCDWLIQSNSFQTQICQKTFKKFYAHSTGIKYITCSMIHQDFLNWQRGMCWIVKRISPWWKHTKYCNMLN